jgi:hypothetical protein
MSAFIHLSDEEHLSALDSVALSLALSDDPGAFFGALQLRLDDLLFQ